QFYRAFNHGVVHRVHGHLHVGAHVDAADVHVNPGIRHRAFALDAHRAVHDLERGELAERNLRSTGCGHDDVIAERAQVGAEIAVVTEVDGVALAAFDRGGERHAAECNRK